MATGLVAKFRLAFDEASKQKLEQEAKQAGKATATAYESGASTGLQNFFSKIGGWLAAAFAVHKIVDFAQASIKAAQESETAWNELGFSLGKVGVNIDDVRGRLEKLGAQFLDKTTFGDEAALRGLNSLVQITQDYPLALNAVGVAADLAAAKHLSLEDASVLVGRALEGNTIQLKRMGVELKAGVPLLEQLRAQFGGAAENELNTFAGKTKQLGQFWQELKEEIGKAMIEAGSGTSIMDTLIASLKGAARWVRENKEEIQLFGKAIVQVSEFLIKQLIPALEKVGPALRQGFGSFVANTTDEVILFAKALNLLEHALRPSFRETILDVEIKKLEAFSKSLHEKAAVARSELLSMTGSRSGGTDRHGFAGPGSDSGVSGVGPGDPGWKDRVTKDLSGAATEVKKWEDFNKGVAGNVGDQLAAVATQTADITITAAGQIEARWQEQQAKQLKGIQTADTADQTAVKNMLKRADELAQMRAEWDEKERQRRKQMTLDDIADIGRIAHTTLDLAQQVLDAGDAWGVFGDAAGKAIQATLNNMQNLASSVESLAAGIVSGNPLSIVQGGLSVIGSIGHFFHRDKDPGRMRTNAELAARAAAGDPQALQQLFVLSGRAGPGQGFGGRSGWATQEAQDDAWAKYQAAKASQAPAGTPEGPVDRSAGNVTPEDQARAIEDQAREKERQIRANEEEGIRLRDLAEEGAAQQKLKSDAQGLSETLQQMVAAAILAQQKAEQVGETGPLGFDSPLFRDAKTRADRAFDEASRAVAEALGKQAEAGGVSANVEAGFTVQRTITETSAGRMIGELTTQSVWLEKIYTVLDKRLWPLPGMENGTPNGAGGITLNMDGQEVARIIGAHQAGNYQLRAELNGAAGMPSR